MSDHGTDSMALSSSLQNKSKEFLCLSNSNLIAEIFLQVLTFNHENIFREAHLLH